MILFLILFVLLLLLPDLYIWLSFVRSAAPLFWNVAYWIPSALALAVMGLWAAGYYQEWLMKLFFGLLLCVAVPKLFFTIVSLAGRGIGLFVPYASAVGNILGLAIAAVTCAAFLYGFTRGWKQLQVRETTVVFADLPPAFDGYRIVQLSDLHIGTFGSDTAYVRQMIDRVNALNPDLIVFTGDLVNDSAAELDPYLEILTGLQAPDGVFSILGNHDYCTYRRYDTADGATRNLAEVKRRQRAFGWDLLLNEHRLIRRGADSIVLIGVENDGRPPFPSRGDLPKATNGIPEHAFQILLSHDPTHWRREVLPTTDIQLTLSGHTHAMQLMIGGFSPARWSYPEWGGLYRDGDRALFVSLGAGGTVPFRLGAWPEINVITLKRSDSVSEAQR